MIRRPPRSTLFPTRRSSDLMEPYYTIMKLPKGSTTKETPKEEFNLLIPFTPAKRDRSEEHTSELQSRLHLVCRLLLEKKKIEPSSHRYITVATESLLIAATA